MNGEYDFSYLRSDLVQKWGALGIQTFPDGSQRIGNLPHRGKEFYLHTIPKALESEKIRELESQIGKGFAPEFCSFLNFANGIKLFSDSIGVYGARDNYDRSNPVLASLLPYDVRLPNLGERPTGLKSEELVVGYYTNDGSQVILSSDGRVSRIERSDASRALNRWPSFRHWLSKEIARLDTLFDAGGRPLDGVDILP